MKSSTTPEAQRKVQKAAVTNSLKPTSTGSMSPNSSSCPQVRKVLGCEAKSLMYDALYSSAVLPTMTISYSDSEVLLLIHD